MSRTYQVGDRFTHVRVCDRYRPLYYAAAGGDFNPIHLDPEAAKAAGLPGVILHGLCTMGWAVEAFVNYLGDPGKVSRVKVRFSQPVRPEDTLTFEGEVVAIEGGKLTAEVSAKNQLGESVLKKTVVEARI